MKSKHYVVTVKEIKYHVYGIEADNKKEAKAVIEKRIPWNQQITKVELGSK